MTEIQELETRYNDFITQFQKEGEKLVKTILENLFNQDNPPYAVVWRQYAPYFNDGDVCEFSVNEFEIYLTENDYDEGDEISYDDRKSPKYDSLNELEEFAHSESGESIFKMVFGDDSKVLVTKEGVEILDYEHD